MFGFGKKKSQPGPAPLPANPGEGTKVTGSFESAGRRWKEEVDVAAEAAGALAKRGFPVRNHGGWLEDPRSGFVLLPQFAEMQILEEGGVQTVTTIQVHHPRLVPEGLFEFQHSTGTSMAESVAAGIDQWISMDWATLLDSTRDKPEQCALLEMGFPARPGKEAGRRRAVLGPVAHYRQSPASKGEEEHPFCPCCLLTQTIEAHRELIEGGRFLGVRFYALRGQGGEAEADCRVNGENWEPGVRALREYVGQWPGSGFEFRKQYVILQSLGETGR
jgi:hypothetical protein